MKRPSVFLLILLAACSNIRPTENAMSNFVAEIAISCGYTDGGAYDIGIDMGAEDLTMHAERGPSGLTSFTALVCNKDSDHCNTPKTGALTITNLTGQSMTGHVSLALDDGSKREIDFHGAIRIPMPLQICG